MTETATENTETAEATAPDESVLNDLARLFREQIVSLTEDYNSRSARLSAATGDTAKAVHDLRNTSDDPKVVKFRKWLEEHDAKREKALAEIDAYISGNLVPSGMSEEEIEAERTALKDARKEITSMRDTFLMLPAVREIPNVELLLPKIAGTRATVSKGTGQGGVKPRVTGVYVDGELCSHETPDGKTKSSFTDAVKFLSEKHKVKVETRDLHAAYFEAANVKPEDWASGPDKVEFGFHVTDKDGNSQNHTVLVTK